MQNFVVEKYLDMIRTFSHYKKDKVNNFSGNKKITRHGSDGADVETNFWTEYELLGTLRIKEVVPNLRNSSGLIVNWSLYLFHLLKKQEDYKSRLFPKLIIILLILPITYPNNKSLISLGINLRVNIP